MPQCNPTQHNLKKGKRKENIQSLKKVWYESTVCGVFWRLMSDCGSACIEVLSSFMHIINPDVDIKWLCEQIIFQKCVKHLVFQILGRFLNETSPAYREKWEGRPWVGNLITSPNLKPSIENTVVYCLTKEIYSEKCVPKQCCHCANITNYTYTNLHG
jgi:hypothetical protein